MISVIGGCLILIMDLEQMHRRLRVDRTLEERRAEGEHSCSIARGALGKKNNRNVRIKGRLDVRRVGLDLRPVSPLHEEATCEAGDEAESRSVPHFGGGHEQEGRHPGENEYIKVGNMICDNQP